MLYYTKMEILIDYISKQKLLLTKWIGTLNLKDYEESIVNFNSFCKKFEVKYVIHNISELEYTEGDGVFDTSIIEEVAKKRSMIPRLEYTVVFITQKPKDIVYSHLYAQELQIKGNYQYCSTVEKALELLLINDSSLNIETRFLSISTNIKKSF